MTQPTPPTASSYSLGDAAIKVLSHVLPASPRLYGVWIPGKGWLRTENGDAFATDLRPFVYQVAHDYGAGARVKLIDVSLAGMQEVFLTQERERTLRWKLGKAMTQAARLAHDSRVWLAGLMNRWRRSRLYSRITQHSKSVSMSINPITKGKP